MVIKLSTHQEDIIINMFISKHIKQIVEDLKRNRVKNKFAAMTALWFKSEYPQQVQTLTTCY